LHNELHAYKFTRRFLDVRPYFVLIRHACAPSFRAVEAFLSLSLASKSRRTHIGNLMTGQLIACAR